MKKIFRAFGVFVLMIGSFIYTEKATGILRETDDIMVNIKENKLKNALAPVEAIIDGKTIIPGINGRKVDVEESYQAMKMIGKYNDEYLKYKEVKVEKSLKNNMDKYIVSGNPKKRELSLIILVEKDDNIDKILEKLDNTKVNFFLDGNWLEKNEDAVYNLVKSSHTLGSLSYNYDYSDDSYFWLDTILKKITKRKNSYCIKVNDAALDICFKNRNYTINPIVITKDPLINTKTNLNNGAIIAYKINNQFEEELELIRKYIESKGFKIKTLPNLLGE